MNSNRPGGTVAGLVLAVALLAACASAGRPRSSPPVSTSPGSPASSSTTPATRSCEPSVASRVLIAKTGRGDAVQLMYRNAGGVSCTMRGYPTVTAVRAPIKTTVTAPRATVGRFGASVPVRTVTLAAGASASALVEWSPTPGAASRSCLWVAFIVTTPPGSSVSTPVERGGLGRVCGMRVLPVVAGTSHDGYALAPRRQTTVGLVISHTKLAGAYRVVLQPATRQPDGQYVAVPGHAPVTYRIPDAFLPDGGITLVGPIEVTVLGEQVTALTVIGG